MRCLTVAGTALAGLAAATALGGVALAGPSPSPSPALAGPQPMPGSGEVSDQNPVAGGTVVLTGHGFRPFEWISFDTTADAAGRSRDRAHTEAGTHLATARADAQGDASATVHLPAGFAGRVPIRLTGQDSGISVAAVTVAAAGPDAAARMAGLPVTGPGVLGYAAAGLVLVVGGAGLVTVARLRRSAHVATHATR